MYSEQLRECDCCGKMRVCSTFVCHIGIDTTACDECRGIEPEAYGEAHLVDIDEEGMCTFIIPGGF